MPSFHSDWDLYLDSMAKDGEWADAHVIVAMAIMLQRDIYIVTSSPQGQEENRNMLWIVGVQNFSGEPLRLGHEWEAHYISLGKTSGKLYSSQQGS